MRVPVIVFIVLLGLAGSGWGQAIDKSVLDQAKDATVFVKVKAGRVQGSGTGFVIKVTGDTVLVMTNKHVIAHAVEDVPQGVTPEVVAVFRSGTPQQQEVPAQVLAYDERDVRDLAVLQVKGVRAPPVAIAADQTSAEADFYETMPVIDLGFPLGSMIQGVVDNRAANPAITVNQMTISSLRRDEAGRLARVQLNGSLIEGNSGGPIIDTKGRLVGVAVARIRGEAVGFAIPPSVITAFLAGDIGGLTAELVTAGKTAQVKIGVRLVDPLGRLKGVAVRYARQPASGSPPPAQPDARGSFPLLDGGTSAPLSVAPGVASGQVDVPVGAPVDRKLVVQFVLTDIAGRITASKPTPIELPERPGTIAGLAESVKPKTLAKWSCEVNLNQGVKIANKPGSTTIDTPGEAPMVNAPQYQLFNAPSALVRVEGDFVAMVKVTNDFDPGSDQVTLPSGKKPGMTFQGAGLLIWQDERNFVRLERCKGSDGGVGQIHRVLVEMYKGGRETGIHYSGNLPQRPLALVAARKGASFQLLYSDPSGRLVVFQEMALDFDKEVFIGVSAANLSMHPFQAKFEEFTLKGPDGQDLQAKPVSMTRLDGGPIQRSDGTWVVEGATMRVLKTLGSGSAKPQGHMDKYGGQWSDNRQLLWSGGKQGDALALELLIDQEGKYDIKAKFTLAPDYGKVNFALDGKSLVQGKSYDFYNKEVRPARWMSLGTLPLAKGKHRLTVTLSGKNASSGGYSFGLDEVQLVPATDAAKKK
ncbi:MAG: trypsin-like peptidase domain-containing protein [Isosphaeraceae bacterium]|nr:trypsin-like peptidase domain-containing protein [Isosphaeraceae bacterium]